MAVPTSSVRSAGMVGSPALVTRGVGSGAHRYEWIQPWYSFDVDADGYEQDRKITISRDGGEARKPDWVNVAQAAALLVTIGLGVFFCLWFLHTFALGISMMESIQSHSILSSLP